MGKTQKNKSERIYVRVTPEELVRIKYNADRFTHGNIADFIRQVAVNQQVTVVEQKMRSNVQDAALYDLLKEYRKIGVNYNQAVHSIHIMKQQNWDEGRILEAMEELAAKTDQLIALTHSLKKLMSYGNQDQ